VAMNFGYGPATAAWPYASPYGAYGNFFPGSFNPAWTPFSGYGPFPANVAPVIVGGGARTDDEHIQNFVERALDDDPMIPPHAEIDAAVKDGVVTLTGTVSNKRIKHAAGDDAWWIPQVLDVHNEINVVSHRERPAETREVRSPASRHS